uniref:Late blight resistance protein homolog R1A-3 isoform X1 n=1 Tax=Nicotiana sylvestris TaxID=4096 RepID=A0A1U7WRR1_NICSY|nr:PREDICTED: putative late blight resistance protein homolog R1A-3 isoform X1 [Nicotiana sylvestris]XP_009777375.1 PREDICTED: putative late blight resistance protein homolog R1A-3 isoform X1 [Nicotiana sylvestris]
MAHNDIEDMLDHLRKIKSRGDLNVVKIETLEMELRFLRTFINYPHALLPDSLVEIRKKAKLIVEMLHSVFGGIPCEYKTSLNVERLVSELQEISEDNGTRLIYNFELNDSYMLEYMDYLDQNLNDAPRYLVRSVTFFAEKINILLKIDGYLRQVKVIQNKLRFLRYLYGTEINSYVDREKLEGMQVRIQFMADNVGQFCLALWVKEDGDDTSNIESKPRYLLCLVVIVELEMKKIFLCELKASKFTLSRTFKDKKLPKGLSYQLHCLLVYLRDKNLDNFPTIFSARNIDMAIEFLLVFLGDIPYHVINGNRLNEILEKVGVLVGDILYVIQMQLLSGSTIKDDASKIDLGTIQLLEKIEDLKAQLERCYKSLKYRPSQFPTVGGLSFLDSLLRKLNEMLKSKTCLDFILKPHIVILEKEFANLTSVFRDIAKVQHEHENFKDLQRRTINLAYEAEVAIDSILAQCNALWYLFCSLPTILKEIKHISAEVTMMWLENIAFKSCSTVEPSKHMPTQHRNLMNGEEIVGFDNDMKRIIRYLTRGTNELDVIPIVGMGGQGKTTCVRKLYNNDIIIYHFDVRAWCVISQTYSRRELLQEIYNQVTRCKDKVDDIGELADMLRKSLIGKRYLIVLDDMWDFMAWDDLRLCFPDVVNRSRIVVTTRLEKVGEHVKCHTDLYFLPFLTPEESRKLLQKKVFQNEACPHELQDVSLDVARRCKGLPLVVVLVAGIIKKKKMERSWWHEVKKALFSYLDREFEDYCRATMQLSYDNLPDYLRPCLLYMGMFPEDERIPVSKLISLWIAEGFVQNIESGRLTEETAEGYLMDLISSNMVMVARRRYNGKVKYCQVHDVVLYFCLERSRQEKFMLAVRGNIQRSDLKESRVSFSFSNELSKFASKTWKSLHQHLRSLITTNGGESLYWNPFSQFINLMRLLKVLDLSSHKLGRLSLDMLKPLIHLKYVALFTDKFDFHGKSHLPHLETLILKCLMHTQLSTNFWKMKKLRHVDFIETGFFWEKQIFEESSKLENLRILKGVEFTLDTDCLNVLVHRCPNLQELEIFFLSKYWRNIDEEKICLKLESLTQLQSLRLFFPLSAVVHLPSNIKKLVLCGASMESTIFSIAGLPSLEYLQLRDLHFIQSEEWCLGDITFPKLRVLKLMNLGISRWDASEESFPRLETLVIKISRYLEEIPLSFADIPTLKQIKLMRCSNNKSLVASALRIKKEVEENEGCNRVEIIIDVSRNKLKCDVLVS